MSAQTPTESGSMGTKNSQANGQPMKRFNYEKLMLALTIVTIILILGVIAVVVTFIIIRQSSSSAATSNNSSIASSAASSIASSVTSGSASSVASSGSSEPAPPLTQIRTVNRPINTATNNTNNNAKSNKSIAQSVKNFKTETNITPNLSLNSNGLKSMSEGDVGVQLQSIKNNSNNIKTQAIRAEQKQQQSKKNYPTKTVLKSLTSDD